MPGRGPAPAETRRRTNEPARGEWQAAPGIGWQHGPVPPCPSRAVAARETWGTWFGGWFASHWTAEDLPNLRLAIKLWVLADTGKAKGGERAELRYLMDDLGITRKGQQERRWKPLEVAKPAVRDSDDPYAGLRAVK